jgi:outer membrane biosynthesis protein TonB
MQPPNPPRRSAAKSWSLNVNVSSSAACSTPPKAAIACLKSGLETLMGGARVKSVKLASCASSTYAFVATVSGATPQATLAAAVQSLRAGLLSALPTLPTCAPSLAATGGTAVLDASYAIAMVPQASGDQPYPRAATSRGAEITVGSGTNTVTFNFTTGGRRQRLRGGAAAWAAAGTAIVIPAPYPPTYLPLHPSPSLSPQTPAHPSCL